jgi:hypothetical protein
MVLDDFVNTSTHCLFWFRLKINSYFHCALYRWLLVCLEWRKTIKFFRIFWRWEGVYTVIRLCQWYHYFADMNGVGECDCFAYKIIKNNYYYKLINFVYFLKKIYLYFEINCLSSFLSIRFRICWFFILISIIYIQGVGIYFVYICFFYLYFVYFFF